MKKQQSFRKQPIKKRRLISDGEVLNEVIIHGEKITVKKHKKKP
ncbi:hypothetical protein [Niallia sp. RD1]|nr:hypothetical protein [Niallia sp. RD1]